MVYYPSNYKEQKILYNNKKLLKCNFDVRLIIKKH